MLFCVHAVDGKDNTEIRTTLYPDHKAYLDNAADAGVTIVMSGPLQDAQERTIGSLFVLEAETLAAVQAFNANDPFNKAGIWSDIKINTFLRRR